MEQRIIISGNLQNELAIALSECEHDRIFVLTDENTLTHCWPVISSYFCLKHAQVITIGASDANKTLETVSQVWEALINGGATRHSCLINLGGGMVTDLGGFAASTFKRGINFINIPTTLLAMVDASVGGKTGFNFAGLKNEIGVFNDSKFVILDTQFLKTLDQENLLSGYAEMLKHALISKETMWAQHIALDVESLNTHESLEQLQAMLADSVEVKEQVVKEDPYEQGIRKALNFGHTFGHAFESWSLNRAQHHPHTGKAEGVLLHGYAVAYGIICELYLSAIKCGFPTDKMHQTVAFIREHYGRMSINCDDYPTLIQLMQHDKKNTSGLINFTLLEDIGRIHINQTATVDEIKEVLDFFREG